MVVCTCGENVAFDSLAPPLLPLEHASIVVDTAVRYQKEAKGSGYSPARVKAVRDDGTFDIVDEGGEAHDAIELSRLYSHGGSLERASLQKGSRVSYGSIQVAVITQLNEDGEFRAFCS